VDFIAAPNKSEKNLTYFSSGLLTYECSFVYGSFPFGN
jgi:hypothetical protein